MLEVLGRALAGLSDEVREHALGKLEVNLVGIATAFDSIAEEKVVERVADFFGGSRLRKAGDA